MTSLLILTGCLLPGRFLPRWLPNDKLMHLGGYFLLMVLISAQTRNLLLSAAQTRNLLLSAALLFLAGLLIECLQHFVPGRHFSWRDQLANTVGIMLGLVV
ncbi:VanZ family protein [Pelobacter sp. M08fum]|uniref:VanZ family protein n=1 Tax=Pelovirga terrestris TaxID=2771352 RepID=A0A8J6QN85_9BACT|nr:VanZ family protein [Pelovirga terrestris]